MLQLPAQSQDDTPASGATPLYGDGMLAELVSRVRREAHAEDAFAALDRVLRPWLLAYYQRASFSHADADELVQSALSRVYLGIRGLLDEARFLPWFFRIARNVKLTALEQRRKAGRRFVSDAGLLEELPDPRAGGPQEVEKGEYGLAEDDLARYRAALEMLPPQQKRCLILRIRDELPYGEIARVLHLSVHTVRNHLQAARKSLRDLLQVDFEEGEDP